MAYKDKEDQRKAWREHYARNKEYYAERNKKRKKEINDWINSLKENNPCIICNQIFPPKAMDWHHRDPKTKEFSIGQAKVLGLGKDKILLEIEKCDLVCAICHRLS